MSRLFTQRRILALLIMALLVSSLLPDTAEARVSAWPRGIVAAVVGWVSAPLKWASDSLRAPAPLPVNRGAASALQRNYDQQLGYNAWLLIELRRTQEQLARYQDMAYDPQRLAGYRLVPADVTAYAAQARHHTLQLNVGTLQGVDKGMIVTDESVFSLVGRITDAGPAAATVELISSPGSQLDVRFLPSTPQRLARELVLTMTAEDSGQRFTVQTKKDDPVAMEYLAHLDDSHWPRVASGLVVGKVTALTPLPDDPLQFNRVIVQPIGPLPNLGRVVVLARQE
ncbi:MAG: rod shape-determining protein MreC [Phycisphaeraceae bacterium]